MRNAVGFMYAGAALSVAYGLATAWAPDTKHELFHGGNPHTVMYKLGGVFAGALLGCVWLWMVRANSRGRSWARVLSICFFGLWTLTALAAVINMPVGVKITSVAVWAAGFGAVVCLGQRSSNEYYRSVKLPKDTSELTSPYQP